MFSPTLRNVCRRVTPAEGGSLFAGEETAPSDSVLQRLLAYADSVTNWISAEIVSSDSSKVRDDSTDTSRYAVVGGEGGRGERERERERGEREGRERE